ncbi:LmbE family N-acetylglucosaminyl deacetylase [Knoellia remsis]|uniref:LmbE family N-acetylglucosaminyl deacetylase n=1 Tax=Knoellia remsis TaxID=407159 RepID=A0A2T0UZ76_9MICO|nr:PIG-L deacetylase family protein [Knoellia remsis]PRY63233.1 LmbE family N-acetylglucosaminyl deacetylase [Knoellia remsis]
MKRLVIAPHMDDESMGCGGLMAKYPDECVVATVTDSGPTRAAEHAEAMRILGVTDSRNLGFEDGVTDQHMTELVAALDAVMAHVRPDEVYLPFPSLHQDHIAVYEAGMRSARVSMSADHHFPPSVLVYDIAAYDVNLYPSDLRWNVFEDLTEDQVTKKALACTAYQSEIPTEIHPINSVKQLAAAAGLVRLMAYAEQYALVRQVRR